MTQSAQTPPRPGPDPDRGPTEPYPPPQPGDPVPMPPDQPDVPPPAEPVRNPPMYASNVAAVPRDPPSAQRRSAAPMIPDAFSPTTMAVRLVLCMTLSG